VLMTLGTFSSMKGALMLHTQSAGNLQRMPLHTQHTHFPNSALTCFLCFSISIQLTQY